MKMIGTPRTSRRGGNKETATKIAKMQKRFSQYQTEVNGRLEIGSLFTSSSCRNV
jgi:hypothetical protein